ncbi:MAG: hypothetical protein OXN44_06380 [Acidimicrobiaceae bacterium]|nr:hypothetical protein [Acidimicrobiaceae bacterium]
MYKGGGAGAAVGSLTAWLRRYVDPEAHLAVLDEREGFLVGDRVLLAEDQELLAVLDKLGDVLAEQAERRVGHHDVGLFQQRRALRATEIAVTFKADHGVSHVSEHPVNVVEINPAVAGEVV